MPLPGLDVLDPAPGTERKVSGDREVLRILVQEDEAAELLDAVLVGLQESVQLVGRIVDERSALDARLHGDLAEDAGSRVGHRHLLPGIRCRLRPVVRVLEANGRMPVSGMELQVGPHPLAQEHRMMPLEHPLTGTVPDGP